MYSFIQRWFAPLKYGSSPLDRMRLGPSDGDRADLNPLMVRLVYPKDFLSSSRSLSLANGFTAFRSNFLHGMPSRTIFRGGNISKMKSHVSFS